jgi:putative membrane protein
MAGCLVLFAAWWGPLPHLAMPPFAVHMIVHISIVAVAAPLMGAWLASNQLLLRLPRLLCSPITASAFEFIVVWSWHTPMLHELAQLSRATFVAEQASFVVAGVLLWTSVLRRNGASAGAGVVALLLTSMHMILLGTLLTLAPRPLYTHAILSLGDLYAGLAGQRLGGMVMLIGGGLPYLAGGLYLVHGLLREPPIADTEGGPTPTGDVR